MLTGSYFDQNFSIMSEFMTPMGRILSAEETGLRRVNQRRIAKAIRRSIGLGLMPSVHRHPEILYKESARLRSQINRMRS
jgi:small subunit ribosomal protein S18